MRTKKPSSLPLEQRLTVSINEAADTLGVGRNTIYKMLKERKLRSVSLGSRNMVTTDSIRTLVSAEAA